MAVRELRAVIVSVGAVTAHGVGVGPLVKGALDGRTAIREVTRFETGGLCSTVGAEAPPDEALAGGASDRASRLLLTAADEALRGVALLPSSQRGVVVGTTKGALSLALSAWRRGEPGPGDPLGEPARALARATKSRGPVITVSAACASSAVALGEALVLLGSGQCDEVLVGGVEALEPFIYQGFHALKALSAAPARPFDVSRSGLSLGEGAAVLLLRRPDKAWAQAIAEVLGFGSSTDGFDQTAPDPEGRGLLRACIAALGQAGLAARDLGRYHAHGTATQHNDRMEAAVHATLFGGAQVPVCGVKGSLGHTLGAAAALDLVVCARTLQEGVLPPVTGLSQVDPAARVPAVMQRPQEDENGTALVASAGFGGINTAVVLRRGEGRP